jgi:hypothetical protein
LKGIAFSTKKTLEIYKFVCPEEKMERNIIERIGLGYLEKRHIEHKKYN